MTTMTFDPTHEEAIKAYSGKVDAGMSAQYGISFSEICEICPTLKNGEIKILEGFTKDIPPTTIALSFGNKLQLGFAQHMGGTEESGRYNARVIALMEFGSKNGWTVEKSGISLPLEEDAMFLQVVKGTDGEWLFEGYMDSTPDKCFAVKDIDQAILATGQNYAHEMNKVKVLEQAVTFG